MVLTYSNRSNARRAALQAGLDRDRVDITVHKIDGGVRFGWKEQVALAGRAITTVSECDKLIADKPIYRNGIKRPKTGGVCAAIWEWLDQNYQAELRSIKNVGVKAGWNINTLTRQYYEYRKFNNHIQ